MIYSFNVERILKDIPRDNVTEIVVIALVGDDEVQVHTTMQDQDTVDLLLDGLNVVQPVYLELDED
jgi:hypothetical protein